MNKGIFLAIPSVLTENKRIAYSTAYGVWSYLNFQLGREPKQWREGGA